MISTIDCLKRNLTNYVQTLAHGINIQTIQTLPVYLEYNWDTAVNGTKFGNYHAQTKI